MLNFLSKRLKDSSIGLLQTPSGIEAALLEWNHALPIIKKTFKLSITDISNVKQLYNDCTPTPWTVFGLNTFQVLVRPLDIPIRSLSDALKAAPFALEPLLPYPLESARCNFIILNRDNSSTKLTSISTKQPLIENLEKDWESLGVQGNMITCIPSALTCFCEYFLKTNTTLLLIHRDEHHMHCILIHQGNLLAAHCFAKNTDWIENIALFRESCNKQLPLPQHFFCTGSVRDLPNLDIPHCSIDVSSEALEYAASIGLALHHESYKDKPVSFLSRPLSRLKKPLRTSALLSLLVAVTFFFSGTSLLNKKKEAAHKLEHFLLTEIGDPDFKYDNKEDFKKHVKEHIEKIPETYPLHPPYPNVSSVLLWINKHPCLYNNGEDPIEIRDFRYTITERPSLQKKNSSYAVKVSFSFATPSSILAREFHQALLKDKLFISQSKTIEWNFDGKTYKTSFYLKRHVS